VERVEAQAGEEMIKHFAGTAEPVRTETEITAAAHAQFGWTRSSKRNEHCSLLEHATGKVAMKRVLKMETDGDKAQKTILEATQSFIRDAEARGLRPPSVYKYRLLFKQ